MLVQNQFEIEDGVLKAFVGTNVEIEVPEGVHTIGEGAFKGMASILKVSMPASLKRIGNMAFKGCRQLKEITFREGLSEIGEYAFHRCHGIGELIFPESLTVVGNYAFLYCDGLKRVVIEGPERLGKAAFSHNLSLREITLNPNLDDYNFCEEVFEGCIHIQKIILAGEVYEINSLIQAMDSHAAYPGLIKSLAKSVYHAMQIEDGVLNKFSINLKSVYLPEGITAIGKSCFFDKKGIVSITLPESLREIRANAFLNCLSLEEITFQNEKVLLDDKAFRGCCNLKKVHVGGETCILEEESSKELVSRIRDQVMGDFYISGRVLMRYMGNEEQIQIPRGVEIIGERCFFGKEQLKTVLCPDSLTEIREQAFAGCVTLQNIVLPDQLKRVEREAFAECKKLLKCNLPEGLEYIGEYAFRRCFLLKPFEPWPAKAKIHPYAFYRAKQFERIEEESEEFQELSERGGEQIAPYAHARESGIAVLKLVGVTRIGKYAFSACPDLEEIVIEAPECVIERNAFCACPKLRKVSVHAKELGKGAFSYCRELLEVFLSGISVLPAECFAGCCQLRIFEAREITRMGARCFDECVQLNSFDFTQIKVIGERAFERCDSLKTVKLQQVECSYHAFADCAGLEHVEIGKDTILKSGAFIGSTQVRSVVYDGKTYEFSKFADGLNRTNNPYPVQIREVIASIYSCFDIREGRVLAGYSQDAVRITVPQDVEEIGQDVFRDHIRLREIRIPQSVKLFGSHAFSMTAWIDGQREKSETVIVNQVLLDGASCKGKVVIPSDVKRIASWCFAGNTDITELVIPSDRIAIESLAFRNCLNLKKITDWDHKEYLLRSVSDPENQDYPDLIRRIFTECINCFKLDEEGRLTESTGNITKLTFPEGIKSIGDNVYKDCHLLETITLSDDTVEIGKNAFENSKWLKSVLNAGAVERIGAQAFSGCQSLEVIELSDRLRELGSRCFEHCGSLKEITFSDNLERIPERAFFRCKSLKRVTVPKSVRVVEAESFAFCEQLEEVRVSAETMVSETAFACCDRVKILTAL